MEYRQQPETAPLSAQLGTSIANVRLMSAAQRRFTESFFRITVSLMNRANPIVTTEFPPAPYVENIGVRPDIVEDYMTRANLVTGGAQFIQAFTAAAVSLVQTNAN